MNLNQVKNSNVGEWLDFTARVVEIKEQKMRGKQDNQRMMTKCKLQDNFDTIGAWVEGSTMLGTSYTMRGVLSEYNNNRYLDWCQIKYTHTTPTAPQTPQNAPQQPIQEIKPQSSYEDKERLKHESICRQCASKCASEVISAYIQSKPADEKYELAQALNDVMFLSENLATWFINGNQKQDGFGSSAYEDDSIPF